MIYNRKYFFCLMIIFFSYLFSSCSNTSESPNLTPLLPEVDDEITNFDKNNIKDLNNAIDTLVHKFDRVYERGGSTKAGIIGSFTYTIRDGNGYSAGSYNYSYTYNFTNNGTYTLLYSQNISNGHGSDGYSAPKDSGKFILSKNNNCFIITLISSKGTETKYRYLISEKFLAFLNPTDTTEYKLDLDKTTYEFNSTDDELRNIEHYSKNSGYNGILGKWTMYIGEMWNETGHDFMGNFYENKYWPKVLEIEFGEDGLFTLTKKITTRNDNKTVTNFVQGVYGVIETGEKDFQLGLVSMNDKMSA